MIPGKNAYFALLGLTVTMIPMDLAFAEIVLPIKLLTSTELMILPIVLNAPKELAYLLSRKNVSKFALALNS